MSGLTDVRTEEEVIAAMLLHPAKADSGLAELEAGDFSDLELRRIFAHIAAARMDEESADLVTVRRRLLAAACDTHRADQRLLALPGGFLDPRHHAPALREMRHRREVVALIDAARSDLEQGASAEAVRNTLAADVGSIVESAKSSTHDGAAQMVELSKAIRELAASDGIVGLRTGLRHLDHVLGGLRPQQMILLGARPAQGKSALALTIAENVAEAGAPVLFFSLEMSVRQLAMRRLAMAAGISRDQLASSRYDRAAFRIAEEKIAGRPLTIEALPDPNVTQIVARMKAAHSRGRLKFAVVDHIGLIRTDGKENRTNEVSKISRSLKMAAQSMGVPLLVLAQFNRSIDHRESRLPSLADYRDSGQLEADADVCIGIHAPHTDEVDPTLRSKANLFVLKNRDGRVGMIPVHFEHERTLFRDRASEWRPAHA